MTRIEDDQRPPVEVKVARPSTARAIKKLQLGEGKRFDNAEALFKDLDI